MNRTEELWAGPFGDSYIERNRSPEMVAHNEAFFRHALAPLFSEQIKRVIEFGPNIGQNIAALKRITTFMHADTTGVEVNARAVAELHMRFPDIRPYIGSMTEDRARWGTGYDLAFTKGVLIHIQPDLLQEAYETLYAASKRWILVAEYHNPTPVEVHYQGHDGVLWKRDFAAEMLDRYPDLKIHSQGFAGKRHPFWPQDDIVWTLMKKSTA